MGHLSVSELMTHSVEWYLTFENVMFKIKDIKSKGGCNIDLDILYVEHDDEERSEQSLTVAGAKSHLCDHRQDLGLRAGQCRVGGVKSKRDVIVQTHFDWVGLTAAEVLFPLQKKLRPAQNLNEVQLTLVRLG